MVGCFNEKVIIVSDFLLGSVEIGLYVVYFVERMPDISEDGNLILHIVLLVAKINWMWWPKMKHIFDGKHTFKQSHFFKVLIAD